jgi:hypothetical protein
MGAMPGRRRIPGIYRPSAATPSTRCRWRRRSSPREIPVVSGAPSTGRSDSPLAPPDPAALADLPLPGARRAG